MKKYFKKIHKKLLTIDSRLLTFKTCFKSTGITLLELLVATGISSIVMISVMSTVGNIYFAQKKTRFSQNFYTESRIFMERIAQFARNNTIDYDRYFLAVGPNQADCPSFDARQKPDIGTVTNDLEGRATLLGYPSIFYWDTNAAGDGTQDRNLGGRTPDALEDPCAVAFGVAGAQDTLYLINGARTVRTALRNKADYSSGSPVFDDAEDFRIEIQRQLGADVDKDFVADIWGPYDANDDGDYDDTGAVSDVKVVWDDANTLCELHWDKNANNVIDPEEEYPILGDKADEDFCAKAYDWTSISPKMMKIEHLTFRPAPNRDPFLNFRIDAAQVHPHVFISLTTDLREPDVHGFEEGNQPKMSLETTVSSRVFGNTR